MSSLFTPGLRNQIMLGSQVLPVLPGTTFSMPENMIIPQVFSGNNLFQYVYVPGLQYPTINLNTMIIKEWFTAVNLNAFFTRSGDDVAEVSGGLKYWDGAAGISVPGCKVGMLQIGASIGDLARCRMTLIGYSTVSALVAKPSSDYIGSNPAAFQHITASGGLSTTPGAVGAFSSFDLTLSNNLDVCPDLIGERYPAEVNSGQLTGTLRVVQQAKATLLTDEGAATFVITPPGGSAVSLAVQRVVCIDKEERTLQFPRQMRERNFVLLGKTGPDDMIIDIS